MATTPSNSNPIHWRNVLIVIALVILIRVPFLDQAVQGDDVYYLYGAMHAQIDPLHPLDTTYAFQGAEVDMRGHPHGPMNSWILGLLIWLFGDVREAWFHAAYISFSLLAALSMLSLAQRFTPRPLIATLLFIAVPPFVINGTSFEADLPFLAFWMASMAWFIPAVDRKSGLWLTASALASALAALTAYQAIFLVPIQGFYVFRQRRNWFPGWLAITAPIFAIIAWQAWEALTGGVLPATTLAQYLDPLQVATAKLRNAVALLVHSAWIVSPLLVFAAFTVPRKVSRIPIALGILGCIAAAIYDPNPLFWVSVGIGLLRLAFVVEDTLEWDILGVWFLVFFAGALVIFFAGSARYLLPLAAPTAILVSRRAGPVLLVTGFVTQLVLSLAMAGANYEDWNETRDLAQYIVREAGLGDHGPRRIWANAEFGLRYYLEREGALPVLRDQAFQPGDLIVTSELLPATNINVPRTQLRLADISPRIPIRLISIEGGSGYSSAAKGLLPFRLGRGPVDRITADIVTERDPQLSYLTPNDPQTQNEVQEQIVSGLYPDGWMGRQAVLVLKSPAADGAEPPPGGWTLSANIYISPDTPARTVTLTANGAIVASQTFDAPGAYMLSGMLNPGPDPVTVTLTTDATYRAPGDERDLGIVVTGIGFPMAR